MGADYIGGSLTATYDLVDSESIPGHKVPKAKLDPDAGHAFIDTLVLTKDTEGVEELSEYVLGLDFDETDESQTDETLTAAYREGLHKLLDETIESLSWRDVGYDITGPIITFQSGGMSWGDTPTEALEVWWKWTDEYSTDEMHQVLRKTGFIAPLGSEECPFIIVPKEGS